MKMIHYKVKVASDEIFTSKKQSLYEPRPMVDHYLKNNMPFTVTSDEGPITVNARYILWIQEIITGEDD